MLRDGGLAAVQARVAGEARIEVNVIIIAALPRFHDRSDEGPRDAAAGRYRRRRHPVPGKVDPMSAHRCSCLSAGGPVFLAAVLSVAAAPAPGAAEPAPATFTNTVGMVLARVAPGTFRMGSGEDFNDGPVHEVTISRPYFIGAREVTQAQFREVMGSNPSWLSYRRGAYPVDCVTWFEAAEFCRRLGEREGRSYRLPTEAEWEFACRAGTAGRWYFGEDPGLLAEHAWTIEAGADPHPVGEKAPNPLGLYDLYGNVYEWTADWYSDTAYGAEAVVDPTGPEESANRLGTGARVVRGGSCMGRAGMNCLRTERCSSTARNGWNPYARPRAVGFRVVCTAAGGEKPALQRGAPEEQRGESAGLSLAPFRAALDRLGPEGGEVLLPPGRYLVERPILLGDRVTLRGAGESTVLVAGDELDAFFREAGAFAGESDFGVLFAPGFRHAVLIRNADEDGNEGLRVRDLRIEGRRDRVRLAAGILLQGVRGATVSGVTIEDCGASAVTLVACRDTKVLESTFRRNHNGVFLKGHGNETRDLLVSGCTFRDNRWCGVYGAGGGPHGPNALVDGPENLSVIGNAFFDHLTDTAVKLHGCRYAIVQGNRIDRTLEAGIECNGTHDMICQGNLITRVDDGMNLKGNGCAIFFGRQSRRANVVLHGNLLAENQAGIWSETIHEDGRQGYVGGFAVVGNVASENAAYGMGGAGIADGAFVGNVNVDNGQYVAPPGQDTAGILITAGSERLTLLGNVAQDARPDEDCRMKHGLLVRGTSDSVVRGNIVGGAYEEDLREHGNRGVVFEDNLVLPRTPDADPADRGAE